jgi:hypothetical protein
LSRDEDPHSPAPWNRSHPQSHSVLYLPPLLSCLIYIHLPHLPDFILDPHEAEEEEEEEDDDDDDDDDDNKK